MAAIVLPGALEPEARYGDDAAVRGSYREALERLGALPGVEAAPSTGSCRIRLWRRSFASARDLTIASRSFHIV